MNISRYYMYKQASPPVIPDYATVVDANMSPVLNVPDSASVFETTMNPAANGTVNRTADAVRSGNRALFLSNLRRLIKTYPWRFGLGGAALLGGGLLLFGGGRRDR